MLAIALISVVSGGLAKADSYQQTIDIRIPDSVLTDDYYVLVYTDSAADRDRNVRSNIGLNQLGIKIEPNNLMPEFF